MAQVQAALNLYTVLHNELTLDPRGVGYAQFINANPPDWNSVMSLLNTPSAKQTLIAHSPISGSDFMAYIKPTESLAITSTQWMQINAYLAAGAINIGDADVQTWINQLWPAISAPNTNAILTSLATRQQSPMESIWQVGTVITDTNDIIRAYVTGS